MYRAVLKIAVLVALCGGASASFAETLRCGGSLVSRGDFAVQVLRQCGEPDFVDAWQNNIVGAHQRVPDVEQWYYNFGSSQLIQILEFREGVLERIDSAEYGFNTPGPRQCRPLDIAEGLSKYRLLEMCGEPVQANSRVILSNRNRFNNRTLYPAGFFQPTLRETWIYNFGRRSLLRAVTLENGIVVNVDAENRGFDAR